ncbi:MAG: acyl carrier protein [Deltaproteobacteria bacterium]|nr:acyl carrier protein [Deltaproteobacteria bacterium]
MTDVDEKIRDIVSVELQIDHARVTSSALLTELGMDSVSALNILFAVEETFGFTQIDAAEVAQIKTIADLERIVAQMFSKPRGPAAMER